MGFSPDSLSKSLGKLVETLAKSYTYILGLLALAGIWRWWRVYLRRDHQTLLLMVLLLLAMIWVRNTRVRTDIRYFFPMVLVSFPWIGLGFLKVSEWGGRLISWGRLPSPRRRSAMAAVLAAVVVAFGIGEANLASARFMREHAELGAWIRRHFGPDRTLVGNIHDTRLVQYYARDAASDTSMPARARGSACRRRSAPPGPISCCSGPIRPATSFGCGMRQPSPPTGSWAIGWWPGTGCRRGATRS